MLAPPRYDGDRGGRGLSLHLFEDAGVDVGAARIAERLGRIAEEEGDHRLVPLCFEDLVDPRLWCHRRVFTAWWKDVTGDTVRELGPMAEGLPYPSGCGAGGP